MSSATGWYYIDAAGAQVGPVDAAAVRDGVRAGRLTAASLAWREGLASWRPLAELASASELDLPPDLFGATPPPPPAGASNPYQPMPHAATAEAGGRNDDDVVPAGFVRRWAALFIDQLVLMLPMMAVAFVAGVSLAVAGQPDDPASGGVVALMYLAYFVLAPLYYALQESSSAQATLGKRALGIKVTDMEGRRIGFGQALGRWFAAALSYLTMYIGFLMAAFTERKRALHDYVAATQVVDRWAYSEHPERQKRGLSGCLVVFLIAMLCVPLLAILAAVSISQYQDYVRRAQSAAHASLTDDAVPHATKASAGR